PRAEVTPTLAPPPPPTQPPAVPSVEPATQAATSAPGIGEPSAAVAAPAPIGPGNGGPGTGHTPEDATFFAVPAQAQSVVFVIDRPTSMALNGALAVARRELCRCLEGLPETARFQVVVYNRHAETLPLGGADLVPATPANVRRAVFLLEELQP